MRLLERIELRLYRSAARVVAVSPAFKDNLVGRGIDPAKIEIVTNGVDLDLWRPRPRDEALRAELGLEGKFVIAYVGTMGMAHGLDFILRAAAGIEDPKIHFLFVGDGSEAGALKAQAAAAGLTNVTFHPPVARAEVPRFIAAADAALVPLKRADTFKAVIPSKIFEAAAMRRPILLGVEGQAAAIVGGHGAGIAYTPEDEQSFNAAVLRLASDRDFYEELQAGCAELAEAYDRDRLAARMLEIVAEVARG
jgi:glycosyltransferase involved in cell wall biosynthesis